MLKERNHTCRHRNQLLRRDVHVIHLVRGAIDKVTSKTASHQISRKIPLLINRLVGLSDVVLFFQITRQVIHLVGHPPLGHFSIGALDETKIVHSGKRGQAGDQTNVRAFRCFNRANAAIVRGVHIANLKPSALAGQTARAKR